MKATQSTVETWLPVVGYEGRYEVSSTGRVRSLDRLVRNVYGLYPRKGQLLKLVTMPKDPRPVVNLRDGHRSKVWRVHVLVAAAFIGPRPEGMEICHNNGDSADNRVSNLRYGTRSDNVRDAVRHGTHHEVAKTHCPKQHPYSPENTLVSGGRRYCRRCMATR